MLQALVQLLLRFVFGSVEDKKKTAQAIVDAGGLNASSAKPQKAFSEM